MVHPSDLLLIEAVAAVVAPWRRPTRCGADLAEADIGETMVLDVGKHGAACSEAWCHVLETMVPRRNHATTC